MADEQEQTKAILPFLKVGAVEWLNSFVLQSSEALKSRDHRFCECSGPTSCKTPSPRCKTRPLSCRRLLHARQALISCPLAGWLKLPSSSQVAYYCRMYAVDTVSKPSSPCAYILLVGVQTWGWLAAA